MIDSNSWMKRQNSTIGDEISDVLTTKTREFFYMCDPSNKGYVTKEDLYRLKDEIGLDDNEVEKAFDQLDTDNDSYLTMEEFTAGFGLFLGVETPSRAPSIDVESDELKPDFVFQVFNLIDHDDKGYITKQDFIDCASTLEIEMWQVDEIVQKLTKTSDVIHFDEFARSIGSLVAISPALQEVKEAEERGKVVAVKRRILTDVFKMDVSNQDDADVERILLEQATSLFKLCDCDNKSYVTREDLLTLSKELTLSYDHIMETFSNLDRNRHGYLTLREFTNGFHTLVDFDMDSDNYLIDENSSRYKKAEELFNLCDRDRKGYVTKQDLSSLITKVGLPEQQLLSIFQQLDTDENGLISFDEFVNGFLDLSGEPCSNEPNKNETYNNSNNNNNNNNNINEEIIYENGFDEMYLTDCRPVKKNYKTPSRKTESESCKEEKRNSFLRQPSVKYESDLGEMINKMEDDLGSSAATAQLKDLRDIVSTSGDSLSVTMFEEFLGKVYSELKNAKDEAKHLEDVLERKAVSHTEEIKKIYDEMENHLQNEKVKLQEMENRRESLILEDVQNELGEKQLQLDKFMQRQIALEDRLTVIKEKEQHLKSENSELLKENVMLESKLNTSMDNMEVLRSNLSRMEEQTSIEKRETLRAAVQATQGLQSEHEHLVRELDVLRSTNEKLRDDRDALESTLKVRPHRAESWADELDGLKQTTKGKVQRTESTMSKYVQPSEPSKPGSKLRSPAGSFGSADFIPSDSEPSKPGSTQRSPAGSFGSAGSADFIQSDRSRNRLSKQGSVMSSYFEPVSDHVHTQISEDDDNAHMTIYRNMSVDESPPTLTRIGEDDENLSLQNARPHEDIWINEDGDNTNLSTCRKMSVDEAPLEIIGEDDVLDMDLLEASEVTDYIDYPLESSRPSSGRTPSSPRQTPVGMNAEDEVADTISDLGTSPEHPSRLYKLVLVGDSSVGKTAFIHRFCYNAFKTFGATIGVDFQVKTMKINHEWVALQLWDTAGQERFRSMTKSYFRRADGVIIMFDLLSESSFLNVKGWMLNIEEGAEDDCIVMLLGNKFDLIENDDTARKISYKMGSQLAKDYNAMYYEVSACSGYNVKESIEILARQLEMSEDSKLHDSVLKLDVSNVTKKKKCCKL